MESGNRVTLLIACWLCSFRTAEFVLQFRVLRVQWGPPNQHTLATLLIRSFLHPSHEDSLVPLPNSDHADEQKNAEPLYRAQPFQRMFLYQQQL